MNPTIYDKTKEELDKVSPTMCLAKWTQTSLHLESGHNRSCCHTTKAPIYEEPLKDNPSYLHNTTYRKEIRKQLLEGRRPEECNICWTDEREGNYYSDRIKKSSAHYSLPNVEKILSDPSADINPSYVELSFDTTCNLKCSYCNPMTSSKWLEEIKQYGPYPTSQRFNNLSEMATIRNREENPFVDSFWEWWPTLYPELKVLRITGGEPLLSKHTFKVIERLIEEPREDLEFAINTNLSVPDVLIDRMIESLKLVKCKVIIYTSCEAYGEKAEYIRYGMNYQNWKRNCKKVLEALNCRMYVIGSYNVFSPTSYSEMIRDTADLRKWQFSIDTNYVWFPFHESMFILDESFTPYVEDHIAALKDVKGSFFEMNGAKRLLSLFKNRDKYKDQIATGRRDFVTFVDEYDKRRGTDFLETFPEMEQFYYNALLAQR